MKCLDDFRLKLGQRDYVPIMIGGMGVDISSAALALEAARLGGIGHISDAMAPTVSDRRFKTKFTRDKFQTFKSNFFNMDKSSVQFDLGQLAEATLNHVGKTMEAKKGDGAIFINCMEKLTMNGSRETLRVRLKAALDAGIDGISLSRWSAPGLLCLDRRPSAFSRCSAGHHCVVAAGTATLFAQERSAEPPT
jgi:nitronate monooxygenase